MNKNVLVGMSGGVDSSVTCMLLLEQGYNVQGVTLRMWDTPSKFLKYGETDPDYIIEARELAYKLGIEHYMMDLRNLFRESIIGYFVDTYMEGKTPNPCVMCNQIFKFKYLLEKADELGCDYVATGHYAQIESIDGGYRIQEGDDISKDQSYFLWRLSVEQLSRILFPLGGYTKTRIREIAAEKGFVRMSAKSDSQEICFVEKDYRDLLKELSDKAADIPAGVFVDNQGRKLGMHKGYPFYTIGQRKGLDIALGRPIYITKINAVTNTITLGDPQELLKTVMLVEDTRWNIIPEENIRAKIRIRYRSQSVEGVIIPLEDHKAVVAFDTPVSSITPGQSAVFYQDHRVIGGGLIALQVKMEPYIKMIEKIK